MAEISEKTREENSVNYPNFLNRSFFEDVLQKYEQDSTLSITNLEITSATQAGDNFSSIVLKAKVFYKTNGKEIIFKSLIVKTTPFEDSSRKEMLESFPIFEREIEMYTKVLQEMRRIMDSIGDSEEFSPKLIYFSCDPKVLIFDDLKELGYQMHLELHNFENTVKIARKLAKFHALSIYIDENKSNINIDLTKFKTIIRKEGIEKQQVFFGGLDYLKEEVKNWPGYEKVAEKLANQSRVYVNDLLKAHEPLPAPGFNVLCHADFHIKNLLFKMQDESILTETMFLDFQMSLWGSPGVDLIPIFYAMGDAECRKRRGEILFAYHESLEGYMKRLGCLTKCPSLLELNGDLLKRGALEVVWGITFLPFFYPFFANLDMSAVEDPTPEAMNKIRKIMYSDKDVNEALREILLDLLYRGVLY